MKQGFFIIITGLSGAGKTQASRCFEDFGFYCVDNLPATLIPEFAQLARHSQGKIEKIALVIDIRGEEFFHDLSNALKGLKRMGYEYEILFLESSPKAIVRRYTEARRQHPLSRKGSVLSGIRKEIKKLSAIRAQSKYILDTSELSPWDLKRKLASMFVTDGRNEIVLNVLSFGYKYGVPFEADLVFDVRFLPNPNYVNHLGQLTGQHKEVKQYILKADVTKEFLTRMESFLDFLIPLNREEGKGTLNIAVGCTGGRHRSVAISGELVKFFRKKYRRVTLFHRDMAKK